jgi:GMP synthase (glutamine-hydrolysing)
MTDKKTQFLLLQARRDNDPMALHEQQCFAVTLGVPIETISCHNLLHGAPTEQQLEEMDLLLIGGSGDFSVTGSEPFLHEFFDFLADVSVSKNVPTFGSCFGFQGLVIAAGGQVKTDTTRAEVGTFRITLTAAGQADPLFSHADGNFQAQLGHKDLATELPSGLENLAFSERVPYQAVRVPGTQVVATQFHPELTRQANTKRYLRYQAGYSVTKELRDSDSVLATMKDSPHASALLPRWVEQSLSSTK